MFDSGAERKLKEIANHDAKLLDKFYIAFI